MFSLDIARAIKKCQSMKPKTLFLKIFMKEWDFLRKSVIIQQNVWKKRIIDACKQINRKNT